MPEIKWFVLMVSVMFGAMFAGMAYEASVKAQCRASFAQSNRPAAEITAICDGRPSLAFTIAVVCRGDHAGIAKMLDGVEPLLHSLAAESAPVAAAVAANLPTHPESSHD